MTDEELRCRIDDRLPALRGRVREYAVAAGFAGQRLDDLVIAVNEAVDNVLDHGGGTGMLTVRREPGGVSVEIVDDLGLLTEEHLRRRPDPGGFRGFGLSIISRLCDQVVLDHPGGRSRLSLYIRRSTPASDATRAAAPPEADAIGTDQP
jgi:serine/threonine-protein kinase RsbW